MSYRDSNTSGGSGGRNDGRSNYEFRNGNSGGATGNWNTGGQVVSRGNIEGSSSAHTQANPQVGSSSNGHTSKIIEQMTRMLTPQVQHTHPAAVNPQGAPTVVSPIPSPRYRMPPVPGEVVPPPNPALLPRQGYAPFHPSLPGLTYADNPFNVDTKFGPRDPYGAGGRLPYNNPNTNPMPVMPGLGGWHPTVQAGLTSMPQYSPFRTQPSNYQDPRLVPLPVGHGQTQYKNGQTQYKNGQTQYKNGM